MFCPGAGEIFGAFGGVFVGLVIAILVVLPRLQKNQTIKDVLEVVRRVVPSLVGDIQIVIGVYQIFASMGITLNVTFPPQVEAFIDIIKSYVSLNIFSLPGVSCLARTSYYQKLYGQLGFPSALMLFITHNYFKAKQQLIDELEDQGHAHDPDQDEEAHAKLKEHHKEKQKNGTLASQPRHESDKEPEEPEKEVEKVDLKELHDEINNGPAEEPQEIKSFRVSLQQQDEPELLRRAASAGCDKSAVHDAKLDAERKGKKAVQKLETQLLQMEREHKEQQKAVAKGEDPGGRTEEEWISETADVNHKIVVSQGKSAGRVKDALIEMIVEKEQAHLGSAEDIKARKELESLPNRAALKKRALASGCTRQQLEAVVQREHKKAKPGITKAERAQAMADKKHTEHVVAQKREVGDKPADDVEVVEPPDEATIAAADEAEEEALARVEAAFEAAMELAGDDEDAKNALEAKHEEDKHNIYGDHPLAKTAARGGRRG